MSIKQRFNSELNIHRSLQHTGILAYEHSFEDADNIYILLETYDKTLLDFLSLNKNLSEIETKKIVLQIIDALKYLQANNVINRNINLSTLVISNKLEVKIGDFSFAAKIENNIREKSIYGSNVLLAPEVLNPEVGQSFEVDIWYLGFLMYTLLVGENPFQNEDINKSYKLIKEGNLNFPKEYLISDSAKNLIVKMLSHDPYKRPTLDMLLSDKLFNNTDFP